MLIHAAVLKTEMTVTDQLPCGTLEERPMLSSHCSCHCLHLGIQGSLLSQVPLGLHLLSLWYTESSGLTCLTWLSSSLWGFPVPLQNSSLTSFIWERLWAPHCNHTFKITSTFHRLSSLCSLRKNQDWVEIAGLHFYDPWHSKPPSGNLHNVDVFHFKPQT